MTKPAVIGLSFVPLLLGAAGCVSYQALPLDPQFELDQLNRTTLDTFIIERAAALGSNAAALPPFDPSDGLSEAEVVSVALVLNPDIRAARLKAGQADAILIAAGSWPNPEVGVGWRQGVSSASGANVGLDVLWELLKPGERSAREDAASANKEAVRAGIISDEWKLAGEVRLQWLRVLAAEQSLALFGEEVALRERSLELVRRRKSIGEGTALDVSAAELDVAEIHGDRRRAEGALESARRELNRLMGLPPGLAVGLSDSGKPLRITILDDISDKEIDRRLLADRSDLRELEFIYTKSEHELRGAISRQYPGIKLGPSLERDSDGGGFLGLGLSIELPLFNANEGEIAEKRNERDQVRADYIALVHRLQATAHEARGQLRTARVDVEAYERDVLPSVKRNQELFEGAFRARELNVLDWVVAQQRVLKARQSYLDSLIRYREAAIQLEAALGVHSEQPPPSAAKPG